MIVGDPEALSASSRRKRMNEGGGLADESTNYQGIDEDVKGEPTAYFVGTNQPEESHTRSLVKGFTWRCLATMTTVVISWFITGEVAQAFQIGFMEFFAKLAIYYLHERVWAKIQL